MEEAVSLSFQNNTNQRIQRTYFLNSITHWMCVTVPPIIVTFGTLGNVMTLVVLRRTGFGTTNSFLRTLAISDLVLLYFGLFDAWLYLSFNVTLLLLHDVICKLAIFLAYSTGVLSAWVIVAMTVQRALSVAWPHRINLICTRRKVLWFITGIICFISLLHAHLLYGTYLDTSSSSISGQCVAFTEEYSTFMSVVWPWIDLLSFSLLPFVFLAISNFVLVWKLKTSMRNVTLTAGHSDNSGVREKRASSITVTLIVVSLTFLALTLPNSIILIIGPYVFRDRSKRDDEFKAFVTFIYFLANFLWYSNSAVDFYIYSLTGNKFRAEIKSILCRHYVPARCNETIIQNSASISCSNIKGRPSLRDRNEEF